jgi:hypothetical protein
MQQNNQQSNNQIHKVFIMKINNNANIGPLIFFLKKLRFSMYTFEGKNSLCLQVITEIFKL